MPANLHGEAAAVRGSKLAVLVAALEQLEDILRSLHLWSPEAPDVHALKSDQPFSCDQLSFPQWLQFILIPRLRKMLNTGSELPRACSITPIAESFCQESGYERNDLVACLTLIDRALTLKNPTDSTQD